MTNIHKQRIAAVQILTMLGYNFVGGEWRAPAGTVASLVPEADAMFALLMGRADALMGCTEGSEEERELTAITDAIEAYEIKRWPEGKIRAGRARSESWGRRRLGRGGFSGKPTGQRRKAEQRHASCSDLNHHAPKNPLL